MALPNSIQSFGKGLLYVAVCGDAFGDIVARSGARSACNCSLSGNSRVRECACRGNKLECRPLNVGEERSDHVGCWGIETETVFKPTACLKQPIMTIILISHTVSWCSWLSHLSNTQKVPRSSLGEIIFLACLNSEHSTRVCTGEGRLR